MRGNATHSSTPPRAGILRSLSHDTSGNTLALMAASLLPLLGIIGGGIDMSRSYLAQSRLQQACDAGVLAARKSLGSRATVGGMVPAEVAVIGDRFFNLNFRDGSYGTEDREFQLYLEQDNSMSGEASVTVPTAVMNVFGIDEVNIDVECSAVLSFQNLDLMMALDTTGSMRHTNAGDTLTRLESMKQVIREFHTEMEGNKGPGVRLRYGFLPYASNVNVGHLLRDAWVVKDWTYQSREVGATTKNETTTNYTENWVRVSGTSGTEVLIDTYPATFVEGTPPPETPKNDQVGPGGKAGYYSCTRALPANTYAATHETLSTETRPYVGPPSGTMTINHNRRVENGDYFYQTASGSDCKVYKLSYDNVTHTYDHVYRPAYSAEITEWIYKPVELDVTNWRTETTGCIEERSTYEIDDYDNIDLTRALDLDIDRIPSSKNPDTQWRPRYVDTVFTRSIDAYGGGSVTPEEVTTTANFAQTGKWWFSGCPSPAQALVSMDAGTLDTYLATLKAEGATYHDIGMIWAGRMLSPTGPFKSANQDETAYKPTNRNLIFLTDGQTEPYDLAYGAYGIDALDQRRWRPDSALSLTETIEQRFMAACSEVKKRNITIWVIAFGTELNPAMTTCAGDGRYFEAKDADELHEAFMAIAASLGDLRLSA